MPGYTIPDVTITQDIPIKANSYTMKLTGVAQVNELMAAFSQDPSKIGSLAGSVTISLDVSDEDPLSYTKEFTVARSFPLVYSYLPFTPETDISPVPSPIQGTTATPTPTVITVPASASPGASPAAIPTPLAL